MKEKWIQLINTIEKDPFETEAFFALMEYVGEASDEAFRIAYHCCGKDNFSGGGPVIAETVTFETSAVLQEEFRFLSVHHISLVLPLPQAEASSINVLILSLAKLPMLPRWVWCRSLTVREDISLPSVSELPSEPPKRKRPSLTSIPTSL